MELKEIIEGCREGSRSHQEELYRHYAKQMFGVCMVYVKNREDAGDVLHNGFFKIFTSFKKFDPKRNLEAWVRTIIVNTAIDHLRKKNRFRQVEIEERHFFSESRSPIFDAMKMKDLLGLVELLPVGARTIFNLYALEGYNHREIAKKLDISEGTSKSQYSRARQLLQGLLRERAEI